jgi:hypothetical protein
MDNYLQQGILAAKAGDKPRAFDLLTRASEIPATSEQAWLWLSGVVNDDPERLFCLGNVLRINPNNATAQRGAEMLRQKGVFPAVPVYPEPPKSASMQVSAPKNSPAPKSSQVNSVPPVRTQTKSVSSTKSIAPQQPGYETDWKKQELSGFFQFAVMELSNGKSHQAVEKLVVGRGASPQTAKTVVQDAEYVVRKGRREKYKKRMTRGFLWTAAGIVITCGTFVFASELGGKFVVVYGAIIYGFIDFIVGLVGWLSNG